MAEHFVPADCADCWHAMPVPGKGPHWQLDWLLPAGPDAAMAMAALPEAAERQQRTRQGPASTKAGPGGHNRPSVQSTTVGEPSPWALQVTAGPAWQGYFALQFRLTTRRPLPKGATGWMALVEHVPANSAGNLGDRWLVRSVAGPLQLPLHSPSGKGQTIGHLQALRWPDAARADRLQARAWLEGPSGRILAVASEDCARP